MRASQNAASGSPAAAGQSAGASRGTSHSNRPLAGADSPEGSVTVAPSGALKSMCCPSRPPVSAS